MTRVIKIGGRPQSDPRLAKALAAAEKIVLVHGGGDEVSMLQKMYGTTAEFRDGLRVTSETDLAIIRMALSGSANKRLVSALVSEGVAAVGLSGEDSGLLESDPLDPATYGFVGIPSRTNTRLIEYLLDGGYMPVISPVSRSTSPETGVTLNVNGDDAAAAIAIALQASELLLVSDVEGVRVDGITMNMLSPVDAQSLVDTGVAQGGMTAKIRAAIRALDGGVERVRISDIAAIEDLGRGTIITRAESVCT